MGRPNTAHAAPMLAQRCELPQALPDALLSCLPACSAPLAVQVLWRQHGPVPALPKLLQLAATSSRAQQEQQQPCCSGRHAVADAACGTPSPRPEHALCACRHSLRAQQLPADAAAAAVRCCPNVWWCWWRRRWRCRGQACIRAWLCCSSRLSRASPGLPCLLGALPITSDPRRSSARSGRGPRLSATGKQPWAGGSTGAARGRGGGRVCAPAPHLHVKVIPSSLQRLGGFLPP